MRMPTLHTRCLLPVCLIATLLLLLLSISEPARAESLNCVQFVQRQTSVGLRGDAWRWWDAAAGHFGRGQRPRPGAVMVFSRTGILPHGHIALVRAVHGSRRILVDHANWSPIHGRRGQVEQAVAVIDVSAANDWSRVRVWYHPTSEIGQTTYAVRGFVYPADPAHHAR